MAHHGTMPLREFQCPRCLKINEHYVTASEYEGTGQFACSVCMVNMARVPVSLPAQHQMGGAEGKARNHANIRKRSEQFHASKRGVEQGVEARRAAHSRVAKKHGLV